MFAGGLALRAPAAADRRPAARGAGPRPVRGHAGGSAVAWTALGRQPRASTRSTSSRARCGRGAVPLGLPDDRDRGLPDAARAARRPSAGAASAGRARWSSSALGALLVCWLQPWQGGTLALIVVAVELLGGGARGERPDPAPCWPFPAGRGAAGGLLLRPSPHGPVVGARRRVERRRRSQDDWSWPWWVDRAHRAAARGAGGARLPAAARAAGRSWRCGSGRSPRWPSTSQPLGTFPYHSFQGLSIPLRSSRCRAWRALADGRAALVVVARAGAADRARHRPQVLRAAAAASSAAGDPYFVFPGEQRGHRRAREPTRGRAACSRPPTPATCCPTRPAARSTWARCRGRPTGTGASREHAGALRGRACRPAQARALRAAHRRALRVRGLPAAGCAT